MRRVFISLSAAAFLLLAACGVPAEHLAAADEPAAAGHISAEETAPSPEETGDGAGPADQAAEPVSRGDAIPCAFYDGALVSAHLARAESEKRDIAGAIVPHYAAAMYMTADALSSVTEVPDTVVVVGPNHEGRGELIQICGRSYVWADGSIEGDGTMAAALAAGLGLETSDAAAREDWSASLQMPYIAHYFPEAQVVTVLLARGADPGQLRTLARLLSEAAEAQSLLVLGSADFSHYQDPKTAEACDRETAQIIADGDADRLLRLGNDHIDSPETAAVLLLYGQALDREPFRADGLFERFIENGKEKAGSYYSYLLI